MTQAFCARPRPIYALDIVYLVQTNEWTRAGLWEFVRRHEPMHVAALIYLLENVRNERYKTPLSLAEHNIEALHQQYVADLERPRKLCRCGHCRDSTSGVESGGPVPLQMRQLLVHVVALDEERSTTNARVHDYGHPAVTTRSPEDQPAPNDRGLYTVLDILEFVRNADEYERRQRPCPITEVVLHNLATTEYTKLFLDAFAALVLPEHLHLPQELVSGLKNARNMTPSVVSRFVSFVRIYRNRELVIDPTNFNYLVLPRPLRDDSLRHSSATDEELVVQPLYQGFSVIFNYSVSRTNGRAKIYNVWGELVTSQPRISITHDQPHKFIAHAVLLPVDSRGLERSWRYWKFRASQRLVLVDLFSVEGRDITGLPFVERLKVLERHFSGERGARHAPFIRVAPKICCRKATNLERVISELEMSVARERGCDLFETVVGATVRRAQALPNESMRQTRFNAIATLDTTSLVAQRLDTESPRIEGQIYRSNEAAHYKFTVLVYAHDDDWLYVCRYETLYQQLVHAGQIERIDARQNPQYRQTRPIVLGALMRPRGIFYARVYCDRFDNIVGMDSKRLTASRHDLPLIYPPMLARCCNT